MSNKNIANVHAAGFFLLVRERKNWQFLLLKHSNRWDLPKGHCDSGENSLATAIRELKEETGIDRDQIEIDPSFTFELSYQVEYSSPQPQTLQKNVKYFLAYLDSKPIVKLTEHLDADWFDWNPTVKIQGETIDPLVQAVAKHLAQK